MPQRRASPRKATRQQQRAGTRLAKDGRKQRRVWQQRDQLCFHGVRVQAQQRERGQRAARWDAQDKAVIGPHAFGAIAVLLLDLGAHRQAPRRQHPRTQRRQHTQPRVAYFIAIALDYQRLIIWYCSGLGLLD